MFNHAPVNYVCPICLAIEGIESDQTWIKQADIFYRDELVCGFIGSKSVEGNECHPLIVPIKHIENIYDFPEDIGGRMLEVAKKVAVGLKQTRNADGITLMQNNEPAGDQHAFHFHLHVFPRFNNDSFHEELWKAQRSEPEERIKFAEELKSIF